MLKHSSFSSLSVVFMCIFLVSSASAQLPAKKNHEVPLDSAKKFIANLNKDAMQMKTKGGMFYRDVFDKILAQKGCVAIRFYYGKMDDGTPTLVAVGVDSMGKDMSHATIAEKIVPCPPYCDETTLLNK